jgi:hypothetical protein
MVYPRSVNKGDEGLVAIGRGGARVNFRSTRGTQALLTAGCRRRCVDFPPPANSGGYSESTASIEH